MIAVEQKLDKRTARGDDDDNTKHAGYIHGIGMQRSSNTVLP